MLLDEIWRAFLSQVEWPTAWEFHHPHRRQFVRTSLGRLNGSIVFESSDGQHGSRYQLTLLGVLLTSDGPQVERMIIRYIEFLRHHYQSRPKERNITSADVQAALALTDDETKLMGRLVLLGDIYSDGCGYDGKWVSKQWQACIWREVETFPPNGDLDSELERLAFKRFEPNRPVFFDDLQRSTSSSLNIGTLGTNTQSEPQKSSKLIFISHSSADKDIADALVDMLCTALNLRVADFLCTSVDGAKLRGGDQTDAVLRSAIREVPAFLSILTPVAVTSTYVLFELGARWGNEKHHIPLLAKGAGADVLKEPLKATNALQLNKETDVLQLADDLGNALGRKPEPAQSYHQKMSKLAALANPTNRLPTLPAALPQQSAASEIPFSKAARKLLIEASKSADGNVSKSHSAMYGDVVSVHTQDHEFLGNIEDNRTRALWLHAFDELVEAGCFEGTQHHGIFRITHIGYQLADTLKKQA